MLFGLGRLPCWHAGGMRSIASLCLMMLSGTQDGEGSGTAESCRDEWFAGLSARLPIGVELS